MKKIFFVLLSLAVIKANSQTSAPKSLSADEVIQKYTAAMGGLDNFNKISTAKLTGKVSAQGYDLPITVQIVNGHSVRTDVEAMGQQIINVYKDGKGWKINPLQGAADATDATEEELSQLKPQSMLASPLMDYKKRGYTVESQGQETVDGKNTYKIKLTTDDKKETIYFLDAHFMPVKSITTRNLMGQDVEIETKFSNYLEFGGVKFVMTRSMTANGQPYQDIKLEKVELNVPIDDKIFNR